MVINSIGDAMVLTTFSDKPLLWNHLFFVADIQLDGMMDIAAVSCLVMAILPVVITTTVIRVVTAFIYDGR